jgi:hypothetical protein
MNAPPVVVFAYNRPDLLARTLASVRSRAVPALYAYSDGAKTAADADGVAAVRRLLASVDWTEVRLVERTENLGLGRSILDGVSAVLREHDRVVILEDDIELAPGTYEWFAAALSQYEHDRRVMSISAWNHPRVTPHGLGGRPFFSGRANSWGWATWTRAWDGMLAETALEKLAIAQRAGVAADMYGTDIPEQAAVEAEWNIWAVRLVAHHMAHGGLVLHPGEPYARHIGWDPRGTHATDQSRWDAPLAARAVIPDRWPEPVEHPAVAGLWRHAAAEERAAAVAGTMLSARLARFLSRIATKAFGRTPFPR